jgi:hypothetical protein
MPTITASATVVSQAIRDKGTGAYCGGGPDVTALTPELAVAYLRELTSAARAIAVRGPGGDLLAGDESPAAPGVVSARLGGHEIAVDVGPAGMPALARHDAEQALRALLSAGADA